MASVSPILTRHDPGIQKERDEFTYLLHFGWLETAEVLAWLAAHKPPMLHLIETWS